VKEASQSIATYFETLAKVGDRIVVSMPAEEFWLPGRLVMGPELSTEVFLGTSRPLYTETAEQNWPREFLEALREHGVDTVPGTGARILDDTVRAVLSGGTDMPAASWIQLVTTAHGVGLRSTATMVYGHIETPAQVVAHLRTLTRIQDSTGGFTEFIGMPFVPADSPVPLPAHARPGPSPRESRAVHAVARLMLAGRIDHVQAAWPKLGLGGARRMLRSGADDLGGLLLGGGTRPDAGAEAGRSLTITDAQGLAAELGRGLRQRSTTYDIVPPERRAAARRLRESTVLPESVLWPPASP